MCDLDSRRETDLADEIQNSHSGVKNFREKQEEVDSKSRDRLIRLTAWSVLTNSSQNPNFKPVFIVFPFN